jgi:hypothetical protein
MLPAVLGMLVLASPASAQKLPPAVQEVFQDFARDGVISPCRHSVEDLRDTRRNIPPDIDQYAPDFPDAVRGALEAHARGDCADGGADPATGGGAAAPAAAPGSAPPSAPPAPGEPGKTVAAEPPAPTSPATTAATTDTGTPAAAADVARVAAAKSSAPAPAPVWVLGGGAALLGLALLGTLLAGRTRRGEAGLEHLRHAWGEAAWRTSATWTDFTEWVRTGR